MALVFHKSRQIIIPLSCPKQWECILIFSVWVQRGGREGTISLEADWHKHSTATLNLPTLAPRHSIWHSDSLSLFLYLPAKVTFSFSVALTLRTSNAISFSYFMFSLLLTPSPPGTDLFYLFMCNLWYIFRCMCGKLYIITYLIACRLVWL